MRVFLTGDVNAQDFSKKRLQIGNGMMTSENNDGSIQLEVFLTGDVNAQDFSEKRLQIGNGMMTSENNDRSIQLEIFLTGDVNAQDFSEKRLQIGNGMMTSENNDGSIQLEGFAIEIKTHEELMTVVFPNSKEKFKDHGWLRERAILCPKNDDVTITNDTLLTHLPGPLRTYKSIDTVYEKDEVVNYPTEFLNSLEISGIPQHKLNLKDGSLIMLLRNLDPPNLCNGTRMSVNKLHHNRVEATVLTVPAAGTDVLIPRIPITLSYIPFQFKRL
ncbi:uncharacterized protein LOC129218343 [Uloborus diversus]|uniref:uncharacterized protein LOC129218343 n=1 Tax=Uloborus diversus TaxID=327109 RepID=UPI00240A077E|nr:uncharacterized protein LOC129218343 [Uloborus diversus]